MAKHIPLTRGKVAIVDDEDFEELNKYKWYCDGDGYARRAVYPTGKRDSMRLIFMHHVIIDAPPGMQVDHNNRNKLDNRLSNLRPATCAENLRNKQQQSNNTSGYKGVCWHKRHRKWIASIHAEGKLRFLGYFACPIEAAKAYDAAARQFYGEFAYLNFPVKDASGSYCKVKQT